MRTKRTFISRHYRAAGQGRMRLYSPQNRLFVSYETDEKYDFRLIYNGGSDAYLCMEPMSCAINAANAPYPQGFARVPYVPPHGTLSFCSRITVIKEGDNT